MSRCARHDKQLNITAKYENELVLKNEQLAIQKKEISKLSREVQDFQKQTKTLKLELNQYNDAKLSNKQLELKVVDLQKQNEVLVKSRHDLKKKYTKACQIVTNLKQQLDAQHHESQMLKSNYQDRLVEKENIDANNLLVDLEKFKLRQGFGDNAEVFRLKRERDDLIRAGYRPDEDLVQMIDREIQRHNKV